MKVLPTEREVRKVVVIHEEGELNQVSFLTRLLFDFYYYDKQNYTTTSHSEEPGF